MLQSVELPAVTQARASGDYHPGRDQWRPLGTTSIFAYAIGVAPSKDNFWSTTNQCTDATPCSHYKDQPTEPHHRLQSAVITLTKGPVAPSDAVGKSDVALIMRSCTADGTLLQPAVPAMREDAFAVADAFAGSAQPSTHPRGEVWSAPTTVGSETHIVRLVSKLDKPYSYDLGEQVAVEANTTDIFVRGPARHTLAPADELNFTLWNIAPISAISGWAVTR